jgi:ribosomal protein L22
MHKYAFNPDPKKSVRVYGRGLGISGRSSAVVCKKVKGMNLEKAKRLLENLLTEKQSLDGKHYTNVSKELLGLLKSGEANAENKGLDTSRLHVHASCHQGFRYMRPRRLKMRGTQKKMTHLQVVLMEK